MADMSSVLAAFATAAADAEGHSCGVFTVQPDGRVVCECGQYAYQVARVTGSPERFPAAGSAA